MGAAACASTPRPASPPCPIQSLAKHNRKPLQLAENKHQRPKSIASFCCSSLPVPRSSNHDSRATPFLFDTNELARKKSNLFTINKKTVAIRHFERLLTVLFDTFERSLPHPLRFPTYRFLRLARHGRIAAL
jgi:hypothetical protein